MHPLEDSLRRQLEKTVKAAREIAEAAARTALEQLGVGEATPFAYLSEAERELRRKLRIHGRQLGDERNASSQQEISRLLEEVAYQHWHRMLFARFLAENNLLMYPDPVAPVAVTLEECEELAADEGAANGWELAARFAARMLPQIFRPDSPVFQLLLPPENQRQLERLLSALPSAVFIASDALGWVYQFWQAKRKDEVNAAEIKIGARELPAVTQLFTEPYMVSFLLDNSLGAWWAARRLTAHDLQTATSEEELRHKASLPGVPLDYLRFSFREGSEAWTPAAGTFDDWPNHLSKLSTLDPCCGSGHFLVAVFLMLVPMRMTLEKLNAREAVDRVLAENIHGLELDQRCVELAAFALALAAWRYPAAGGYRPLPELQVACSGLALRVARDEWKQLALRKQNLRIALDWLYEVFADAPVLGSLINPAKSAAATLLRGEMPWHELAQTLAKALAQEPNETTYEAGVVAQGLAKAATLLAGNYQWVVTNVPYLARGKQDETLREFCESQYPEAKNDLATVFLDRCLQLCVAGGTTSIVLPQNWLFLTSYRKFREKLLQHETWHSIARLGPGAFETISGEVVKAILITLSRGKNELSGGLFGERAVQWIHGLDVSAARTADEKAAALRVAEIKRVEQAKQLENPDTRVTFDNAEGKLLSSYADSGKGICTFDSPRFLLLFWEQITFGKDFVASQSTVDSNQLFQGANYILLWENGEGAIAQLMDSKRDTGYNTGAWKVWSRFLSKPGILISPMREITCTLYLGGAFDNNTAVLIPKNKEELPAIWCFCTSPEYNKEVRRIDQSLKVTDTTLLKVPFDLDHWTKIAEEKYPNGLPKPYSDDPTQWIFHGHPVQSEDPLQVAAARLLDYHWPAELDGEMELSAEARAWVAKAKSLDTYADQDGIVCLPPVRGEPSAAERLLDLLAAAYADSWRNDTLAQLLKAADHADKSLESWLRDKFFAQHCKRFHDRPFVWHIWDGLRDGFAALVNVHKLDRKVLETLTYTYVGDWISRQRSDLVAAIDGAAEKLAAAEQLQKRLELILHGEAPYDIFVRWKPLAQQPIGWQPDLNDGVRLNIRPFLSVPDIGKRGAGILRDKPNIKWEKDRGKDVASAPWYHLFNGERINDHHLTLAEKQAARGNKKLPYEEAEVELSF